MISEKEQVNKGPIFLLILLFVIAVILIFAYQPITAFVQKNILIPKNALLLIDQNYENRFVRPGEPLLVNFTVPENTRSLIVKVKGDGVVYNIGNRRVMVNIIINGVYLQEGSTYTVIGDSSIDVRVDAGPFVGPSTLEVKTEERAALIKNLKVYAVPAG